ncbi:MAG: monovalent cation/H+ antiporter subunit D family protein [Anaerolineaceae bacterium]|nr:MAG: monovalent cation/H+ antiporter subunit D family protein [Anaerolineaceae bacterium]
MTWESFLPVAIVLSSMIPGLIIFWIPEKQSQWRTGVNLLGAVVKLVFIAIVMAGVWRGDTEYEARLSLLPDLDLVLRADGLGLLFVVLSGTLWLVTTIYAIGYLEHSHSRSRFFAFFSLCVSATMGIALAGNLFTFLIFYELLTICTYPLVIHNGTDEAMGGGRTYLAYTLTGGVALLVGVVWLSVIAGPVEFTDGGALGHVEGHVTALTVIFALFMIGTGVKAAIFPMHGWLPRAMVAPAPVSALLHAVAVVKAGAFGVSRIVIDVYGVDLAQSLNLLLPLLIAACTTVIVGSVLAVFQDDLKRRLAYSTVSQVSYVVMGVAIFGPIGAAGGLLHLVHQGVMKITLFFGAGAFAETLGVKKVSQMNGIGSRMPWTMAAFTVGALGMIGVPPVAGFISKWYLGTGAIAADVDWVVLVLLGSSLLNAIYFLPILYRAWFLPQIDEWPHEEPGPANWMLVAPPVVTAVAALLLGVFASADFSLLSWVELIIEREYMP